MAELKTPIIKDSLIETMNQMIVKALENRDEANRLIKRARTLVLQYNNLLSITDIKQENFDVDLEIRMTGLDEFENGWRLDAHFYNIKAKEIIRKIQNSSPKFSKLVDVCEDIIIGKRFKRNYVESNHGTPFIGSKNILQIRPSDLKYLSNSEISFMADLMLNSGMILIACSGSLGGTFGKTCLVHKNFEEYAASQHIVRIVPENKKLTQDICMHT